MKLFFSNNCLHFAKNIKKEQRGSVIVKQFSDHELYVKIEENIFNESVWLIASTFPPAQSMLELFFMLDALERCKATINLLLVYCAYARQDRAEVGESLSLHVFFNCLKQFSIHKMHIMHMHSRRAHEFFDFANHIPYDFFASAARGVDAIAAPDKGAHELATIIAQQNNKELILIEKRRPEHERVEIVSMNGAVRGKNVLLVDDMINTGGTICRAADFLKAQGAAEITVAATHGIFAGDAVEQLSNSAIKKIVVSNTIVHKQLDSNIQVFDIWPMLASITK